MRLRRLKRWLVGFAMIAAAVFFSLNALAYRQAYAMLHFAAGQQRTQRPEKLTLAQKTKILLCGVVIPRPQTSVSALDLGPAVKNLRLDGTNGVSLGAWYCPAPERDSLVILFHGYSSEKSRTLAEAKAFLEMGFSVLLVDFRGSGDSSESYTTIGFDEADDVAAAVAYARANLSCRWVILYGQSMGAVAILRAVHNHAVQPDAIIVEAVFDRLLNTVRHRFAAMGVPSFPSAELLVFWGGRQVGFNGFSLNPVEYAADVKCPILFLHGSRDPRARVEEARRVFAAVPGFKRFKEFPGIGHEAAVVRYAEEWKSTVTEFLAQANKQKQGPAGL